MSKHDAPSPPATTYTPRLPFRGATLTCTRCGRVHPYPRAGEAAVRCECGWSYLNRDGRIEEEFLPRLGV